MLSLALNLPSQGLQLELLIFRFKVDKTDLESPFSKTINSLAKDAISRHLYLKRKHGGIYLGFERINRPIGINGSSIFQSYGEELLLVMKELFENPQLAFYPTELCLDEWSFAPEPEEGDGLGVYSGDASAKHTLLRSNLQHSLNKLLNGFHLIRQRERKEWHKALMSRMFKGPMIALMFLLLSNIRHVKLWSHYLADISGYIWTFVERIAATHRSKGSQSCSEDLPLSNLQQVTYHAIIGDNDEDNIRALIPFAMLPSVRVLNGRFIASRGYHRRNQLFSVWPATFPTRTSNVTKIKLSSSRCSPKTLDSLVAGIARLEEFSYFHCSESDQILYEPRKIIDVLKKYTSTSLRKLTLCALQDSFEDEENNLQLQYVGSLKQFRSLEVVVADDKILQRRWLRDGSFKTFVTMKPLVDALPISTTSITLLQNMTAKRAGGLFRDLAELKRERLPKLRKLSYHARDTNYATSITESTKRSLEEVGIAISITPPSGFDMYECPTEV